MTNCTITSNSARGSGGGIFHVTSYESREGFNTSIINCRIIANTTKYGYGAGLCLENRDNLLLQNCIISYNKLPEIPGVGGGIYCAGSSILVANCTITHNGENGKLGGGIFCWYESNPAIVNTIFSDNRKYAIYECFSDYNYNHEPDGTHSFIPDSDPTVRSCLFDGNPDGDYFDEGANSYTGAWQIQQHVPEVKHCVDGDPLFVDAPSGKWTQAPTYDAAKKRTTLTDSAARFKANELAGRLILIDEAQGTVGYVMANGASTIQIFGDWSKVLKTGQKWKLLDWHVKPNSPAVDMGTPWLAPADDLDGNPRPIDTPLRGAERTGNEYDIGAYEVQVRRNAMEGEWTLYR